MTIRRESYPDRNPPLVLEFIPLDVCADCLAWAANGEWTDEFGDVHYAAPEGWPGIDAGWEVNAGSDHSQCAHGPEWRETGSDTCPTFADDSSFSWSPCDACRRPLGGDRYAATMVYDSTPEFGPPEGCRHPSDCGYCYSGDPYAHAYEPTRK